MDQAEFVIVGLLISLAALSALARQLRIPGQRTGDTRTLWTTRSAIRVAFYVVANDVARPRHA